MPFPVAAVAGTALMASSLMNKKKSGTNPYLEAAMREFNGIKAPSPEEMKVQLDMLVQQGVITPEQAQTYLIDGSAFEGISTDPATRNAQMQALMQLQEVSRDGITPIEMAATRDIQDNLETTSRGDQGAIMENMKARGIYGGGEELAKRMLASQSASSTASRAGLQTAADARTRALQAMMQTGQLSGQIRGQDYDEASRKAAALDEIRKFNTQNQTQVGLVNTAARNAAQATNLAEKQRVSDVNTTNVNQNKVRDADMLQRNFENQMNLARGKTGQLNNMATLEEERRKNEDAYRAALLGAGGQILASLK